MTKNEIANLVEVLPVIRLLKMPTNQKRQAIESFIPIVVNEIASSHDWDFAMSLASTVTVASQSEYTLKGDHQDCREIVNVRYGDNLDMLIKKGLLDMDEFETDRTLSGVGWWVPSGRDGGGFPKITLHATPSAAGKTISYRYRQKEIGLGQLPTQWHYVVIDGVTSRLVPGFKKTYERGIATMRDYYDYGGNEASPAQRDPELVRLNNERAKLYGWS